MKGDAVVSAGSNATQRQPLAFALESELEVFPPRDRLLLQMMIWPPLLVGVLGNAAVLCRIVFLPSGRFALLKPFYRCALVSFALSDLALLVASGSHTLTKLSFATGLLWHLPDWTCVAIPFLQTVSVIAGSLTLASVAVDRYRALIPKCPANEAPSWSFGICYNLFVWLFASVTSYPIIGLYEIDHFIVIGRDSIYDGRVCSTDQKHTGLVYTALFIVIFVPLTLVFLLVHVLLALNIWRRQHQQQQHSRNKSEPRRAAGNDSQSTEFSSVSNSGPENGKRTRTQPQPHRHHWQPTPPRCLTSLNNNSHARRKRRTLNVILVLIFVFLAGRLPSWTFVLCKQHLRLSGAVWHYLQTCLTGLTFLAAALDPFLYAFLCEALSLLALVRNCCANADKSAAAPAPSDRGADSGGFAASSPAIVPRGPYSF